MRPTLWLSFLALCILSATRGAVTTLIQSPLPTGLGQTLHFGILAFAFALPTTTQLRATFSKELALNVALFFPLPVIAGILAEGHVSAYMQVVVFALLPSVIVLAIAHKAAAFGPDAGSRRLLVPAIAGAAGTLMLLPLSFPGSTVSRVVLVLVIVAAIAAALGAIRLHTLLAPLKIVPVAAIVCGVSTILLALFTVVGTAQYPLGLTPMALLPDAIVLVCFDAPILLLTLWLLREMGPVPFAARYLLIPLVAILEAFAMIRPPATPTTLGGLALMAGAGVWLLLSTKQEAA